MINELIKLANHLDSKGLRKEADYLDQRIGKMSQHREQEGNYQGNYQRRTVASEMNRIAGLITANGAADTDPAHPCAGERVTLNFYRARLGYYENPKLHQSERIDSEFEYEPSTIGLHRFDMGVLLFYYSRNDVSQSTYLLSLPWFSYLSMASSI